MNGRSPITRAIISIWLALVWLAAVSNLQAQSRITGEGTHGFRALLAGKGLAPIQSLDDLDAAVKEDPNRVLIISFHGARSSGQPFEDAIDQIGFDLRRDFVDRGGALLVATDQILSTKISRRFPVTVTGKYVAARLEPGFDNSYDCPYVARRRDSVPNLFQGPGGDLGRVATNRPSCLLIDDNSLPIVAVFPARTWRCQEYELLQRSGVALPFARAALYPGGGRFLLLADHSVFINSMMLPRQASNDNLQFASNCIDWLIFDNDGHRRTHVIFMEDGIIWQKKDYDLSLQALPLRPDEIADYLWENKDLLWKHPEVADAIASEVEQSGVLQEIERADPFNQFLDRNVGMSRIVRGILIIGAIALAGYAAASFMGSRHSVSRKNPRLSTLLNQLRPRVGLLDQRVRNGIGRGLFEELAGRQARAMFAQLNLTPAEGAPQPAFTVAASWWRRGRIARDLRRVWVIAFSPEPVVISARQREQWQARLDKLGSLIRDRIIRIG